MNKKSALQMISNGESTVVEFKSGDRHQFSSIYCVMCAFANTKGGKLLIGVSDEGEITGCDSQFIQYVKDRIEKEIYVIGIITPLIAPTFEVITIDGKNLICISVPKSKQIHSYMGKEFYRINHYTVSREIAVAYKEINKSGVFNFLVHSDGSEIDSFRVAFLILESFKQWVEDNKGWQTILHFPKATREKDIQRLFDLKGRDVCVDNNIDMSFEANEGPGPVDLKLSRGNDKTVIEIKLSTNGKYLHGYKVQIEEYAKAEETKKRIYVFIQVDDSNRIDIITKLHKKRVDAGENPPELFVIDSRQKESASKKV